MSFSLALISLPFPIHSAFLLSFNLSLSFSASSSLSLNLTFSLSLFTLFPSLTLFLPQLSLSSSFYLSQHLSIANTILLAPKDALFRILGMHATQRRCTFMQMICQRECAGFSEPVLATVSHGARSQNNFMAKRKKLTCSSQWHTYDASLTRCSRNNKWDTHTHRQKQGEMQHTHSESRSFCALSVAASVASARHSNWNYANFLAFCWGRMLQLVQRLFLLPQDIEIYKQWEMGDGRCE